MKMCSPRYVFHYVSLSGICNRERELPQTNFLSFVIANQSDCGLELCRALGLICPSLRPPP